VDFLKGLNSKYYFWTRRTDINKEHAFSLQTFLSIPNAKEAQKKVIERMATSGMLRRMALVRIDVSEELSTSVIRVIGIGELRT
jgi:hypothetical protein